MAFNIIHKTNLRGILSTQITRNLSFTQVLKNDSKDDAKNKLNDLLQSIIKDDSFGKDPSTQLASTNDRIIPKKKPKQEKPKDLAKKIIQSAEAVSKTLSGKPEETEAQLLHKLLYKDGALTQNILKATTGKAVLTDLLSEMPIERPKPKGPRKEIKPAKYSRAQKVRDVLGRKDFVRQDIFVTEEKVNIFDDSPLGIFKPDELKRQESTPMKTWETMKKRDFKLLVTHPPNNIYEQMILWTERGILWKFPIDNECGLEEEENTDFTEHVFLETHLEDWCPEQGPIRHFMELVCVGLSRNHWLSATEKKEHLLWYKEFFTSKKELVKELGAGEIRDTPQIQ